MGLVHALPLLTLQALGISKIYFLFYLYIYPPDSQESNGGANT